MHMYSLPVLFLVVSQTDLYCSNNADFFSFSFRWARQTVTDGGSVLYITQKCDHLI